MKKIFLFLSVFFISTTLFAEKIKITVPSFDSEGNIVETVYVKDIPDTYDDAIDTINLIIDIYNEVSSNYKNQIIDMEKYCDKITEDLTKANEQITTLKTLNEIKDDNDSIIQKNEQKTDSYNFSLKNNMGIIAEYGCMNKSNEVAVKFALRFWRFSFEVGPNLLIPTGINTEYQFGFRGGIGFWF